MAFRLPEENEGHFHLQAPNSCSLLWLLSQQIAAQDFQEVEITTFVYSIISCFMDKMPRKTEFQRSLGKNRVKKPKILWTRRVLQTLLPGTTHYAWCLLLQFLRLDICGGHKCTTIGNCLTTGLGNLSGSAAIDIANRPKEKSDYAHKDNFTFP